MSELGAFTGRCKSWVEASGSGSETIAHTTRNHENTHGCKLAPSAHGVFQLADLEEHLQYMSGFSALRRFPTRISEQPERSRRRVITRHS